MYEIKVIDEFCGAHNLKHYKGKCEAVHGHNWKIEVVVREKTLDKKGMIMDFKDLKCALLKVLEKLDHKYLNDIPPFKTKNPTSENIARYIHGKLLDVVRKKIKVFVWETSTSCASFEN